MKERFAQSLLVLLLEHMEEGVHVIDKQGYTLAYNRAMQQIEGLIPDEVIGKHLSEIFPRLDPATSTLLRVIESEQSIEDFSQEYTNLRGERIRTINNTYPIILDDEIYGAVELSRHITDRAELSSQVHKLIGGPVQDMGQEPVHFDQIIGSSEHTRFALARARQYAQSDAPVLIVGASGTGKEMFARSIHQASDRTDHRFIALHCGALSESVLDSLLFGSVSDAFVGADDRPGLLELCHEGSLFLDEIDRLSQALQSKLLRFLETGQARRLGASSEQAFNVRIMAALNHSPQSLIARGCLRQDLYFRLNVLRLDLAPLAQRPDDLPELIDYFIQKFSDQTGRSINGVNPDCLAALERHEFSGNVRELEHVIEAAIHHKASGQWLELSDLPDQFYRDRDDPLLELYPEQKPLPEYMSEIERNLIQSAFYKSKGHVTNTAKRLGLPRQNLQYKLKKYKIFD